MITLDDQLQLKKLRLEWELAMRDPWFFLTHFVYTFDPQSGGRHRFPNKRYLRRTTEEWKNNRRLLIAKSRQLMCSWLFCALYLWECLSKPGSYIFFQSKKEEMAGFDSPLSLLSRVIYMYKQLPKSIQDMYEVKTSKQPPMFKIVTNNSTIHAISQDSDSPRTYTSTGILADELAFQENAQEAFTSALPTLGTTGRYTGISSPNGETFFYKSLFDGHKQSIFPNTDTGIRCWTNEINKFRCMFLHYTADETKRSEKWKKLVLEGMPYDQFRQEYEIDFTKVQGTPVFASLWKDEMAIDTTIDLGDDRCYVEGDILWRQWDFGYIRPACCIWKINRNNEKVKLKEWMGFKIVLSEFIKVVLEDIAGLFPNARWEDQCDPAGQQSSDKSEVTSIGILEGFGIHPTHRWMSPNDRVKIIQEWMNSGKYFVDKNRCPITIEAMKGCYLYDKKQDKPMKDGYYEHIMECDQYGAIEMNEFIPGKAEQEGEYFNRTNYFGNAGY
jgi:hypothetical protein